MSDGCAYIGRSCGGRGRGALPHPESSATLGIVSLALDRCCCCCCDEEEDWAGTDSGIGLIVITGGKADFGIGSGNLFACVQDGFFGGYFIVGHGGAVMPGLHFGNSYNGSTLP